MSQKPSTIVRSTGPVKKVEEKKEVAAVAAAAAIAAPKSKDGVLLGAKKLGQPIFTTIQPLRCRAPNKPNCCEQPEDECKKKCGPCGECPEKVKRHCKKGCPKDKDGVEDDSGSDEESSEEQGRELQVSKAFLTLDDAASPVDLSSHAANPDLISFLSTDSGIGYGAATNQFLCNFLVVGYNANQNVIGAVGDPSLGIGVAVPASLARFQLPVVQVFDTSCGCLNLIENIVEILNPAATEAVSFGVAVSPSPERPWVAVLVEKYDTTGPNAGDTVEATILLYALQQDGSLVPVSTFNLLTELPNPVFANLLVPQISAENLIAFSSDGRYLEISFSQGSLNVNNGNTAVGILKIGSDGTITLVADAPIPNLPPLPNPPGHVLWLPQPSFGTHVSG